MITPVVSNIADFFTWKTTQTIASSSPVNNANRAVAQFQIQPESFFVFMGWRGSTNYDSMGGEFATDDVATALYPQAIVPNFFDVEVKRNNDYDMMPVPMPQGVIASYGYSAGVQMPWPIFYTPSTRFNFKFRNIAPVIFTEDNQSTAIPLRIDFGMYGFNVPVENIKTFLLQWPQVRNAFQTAGDLRSALAQLSAQDFTGIVPGLD